ncbi:MAG: hypothetical protein MOP51_1375 [Citricoccus sp.]|nr:hypothetical protein [Citricoccus sp. WCRC_4]
MDNSARAERVGVVLRHPDRPIPSRRRLLLSATPAMSVAVLTGLAATWWAGRTGSEPLWFLLVWAAVLAISWVALNFARVPRPFLAHTQQRRDVTAARRRALRANRLPNSSSIRIGAAARSCGQLENMALLTAVGATIVAGTLLRPELPWLPVIVAWGVLTATTLVAAVRAWAFLRMHERRSLPPTR